MIEELGPQARALLAAAREGMSPDPAAVRRMRAKVGASVGAGALAIKLGLLALVAAVGFGAVAVAHRSHEAEIVAAPVIEPATPVEARASSVVQSLDAPPQLAAKPMTDPADPAAASATGSVDSPDSIEMPVFDAKRPKRTPEAAGAHATSTDGANAHAASTPAAPVARATLAREIELIDQAMKSLRANDAEAVLATIHTYEQETAGAGQMAVDAAAIDVEARCRSHDATASAKLDAFDVHWPRSAQRSRLAAACGR